ncbi:MAG TPA: TIGR00725 family protein [Thermoleophilia bacterium]|nr:TIGR00725 family protein [Thermoleophilia bacterium]
MTQTYVSVIGASRCGPELAARAEELGRLLARRGCIVVCGGRSGVMEAVARGVAAEGGVSIGLLPEADRSRAAPDLTYSLPTAIGWARNLAVVASGDAVIAVGGAWGTLSEIALARNVGRRVVLLDSWELRPPEAAGDPAGGSGEDESALDGVLRASSPAEAVELALAELAHS